MDPVFSILNALATFWADSWIITALKFLALIYILVIIVDIILLISMIDLKDSLSENILGGKRPRGSRNKYIKRWETILSRLESDNTSQYKVAILEADKFAEEILTDLGFGGAHFKERLEKMNDSDIETKDALITGHAVRNRIINEPTFEPTREEAEATLKHFSSFFKEADIF